MRKTAALAKKLHDIGHAEAMSRTVKPVKRKLMPKQRVLREFPSARQCYDIAGTKVIGIGQTRRLGEGLSWAAAWADAARRLK